MKKALILINAYASLASSLNQSQRLREELELWGVSADIRRNDLNLYIADGIKAEAAKEYGFCIYLDKDKYTSRMLEASGLRLFNSSHAVEVCDDKALTHIALAGKVPMPETVTGLLCYSPEEPVKESVIDNTERVLGYPVIVKESYGSLGKGVYKADNREQLISLCEKLKCVPHLFQKCVIESLGTDIRVIVIGGECVAAMERRSNGDFRSNIELGGRGTPYEIDAKLADICGATAKILGLDYCGIDVLKGEKGYLVCEVNSNAFFGGIEKVTGANIARLYAKYILREMKI